MSRLRSAWRNLVHRSRVDRDLDDELAATFELIVDERIRQGAAWLAAGVCGGAAGIALVVRVLHAAVPGAPASDPIAAGGAVALLAACAAAALLVPISRAARVDPIAALRAD